MTEVSIGFGGLNGFGGFLFSYCTAVPPFKKEKMQFRW